MKFGRKPKYFVTLAGEKLSYSQLALKLGLSLSTIYSRSRGKLCITRPRSQELKLTYKGETLSIKEWAKKLNLLDATIRRRLKEGWPTSKVLSQKRFKGGSGFQTKIILITWQGKTLSMTGWAKKFGVSRQRISKLLQDYSADEAFSRYVKKRSG